MSSLNSRADWPELPLAGWIETRNALQLWLQIVGKIRLTLSPAVNHSWNCTFYLTARGITTSPIPHGTRSFTIDFDFFDHRLIIATTDGRRREIPLEAQSVAAFYSRVMEELAHLELPVRIVAKPNELSVAVPFAKDDTPRPYDADAVNRFWRALQAAGHVAEAAQQQR